MWLSFGKHTHTQTTRNPNHKHSLTCIFRLNKRQPHSSDLPFRVCVSAPPIPYYWLICLIPAVCYSTRFVSPRSRIRSRKISKCHLHRSWRSMWISVHGCAHSSICLFHLICWVVFHFADSYYVCLFETVSVSFFFSVYCLYARSLPQSVSSIVIFFCQTREKIPWKYMLSSCFELVYVFDARNAWQEYRFEGKI